MPKRSKFLDALDAGLRAGGNLATSLTLGPKLRTLDDARALADALDRVAATGGNGASPALGITRQFLDAPREARRVLFDEGIPKLIHLYDRLSAAGGLRSSDRLSFLKVFAAFPTPAGLDRIVEAARDPRLSDAYWPIVFGTFVEGHPLAGDVIARLSDPPPEGFAGVAFLDLANRLCLKDRLGTHPFDGPAGVSRLGGWLSDGDPAHASYARSGATALPFIRPPERGRLLDLAMSHADPEVRLEAAWAAAKVGDARGVPLIATFCRSVENGRRAAEYLRELGQADAIPPEATDPDFRARAEMAAWLAHPNEFGRAPDELELYDTRELYWPPTNDTRRVWLFRYRYAPAGPGKESSSGLGMVGSVTFALFGEATANLPPEDAYALHCCWELGMSRDPRAPAQRSVEAGRRLLGFDHR